jgi:hypothetical protein
MGKSIFETTLVRLLVTTAFIIAVLFPFDTWAQGTGAQINESAVGQTLYVDQSNPKARDSNPGTVALPFLTIGRAATAAALKVKSGTDVVIGPGTYRESIDLNGAFSASDPAPLILEASEPGQAIISGSDVWTGWHTQSGGTYTLPWPYTWGNAPTPSGWPALMPIVTRREMVFVNGTPLQQVLSLPLPEPGTFNVVDGRTITIWPPAGTAMSSATIEVATRSGLLQTPNGISLFVLRGLTFEHDNTAVNALGNGAVKLVGGSNILVDNCIFNNNNWLGLSISGGPAQAITVQNSRADHNGENGISFSKLNNLLFDHDQTSSNNWRGGAGGFTSFDADGMKVSRIHNATLSNYVSAYNQTGGAWFDTDNENIVLDSLQLCGNLTNGLFIEASQGPVAVSNSQFLGNVRVGLQLANSTEIAITNTALYSNAKAILVGGSDTPRSVTNYATNQVYSLLMSNMTVTNNDVTGTLSSQYLLTSSLSTSWALFIQTLSSNYNDWYNPYNLMGFSTKFGRQNLSGWQQSSKQDRNSVTTNPGDEVPTTYCGILD